MDMDIVINGTKYQTQSRTAAALLEELNTPKIGTAVAVDGAVVARSKLQQTPLNEGAKIEIVRAVQGG